MIVCCNFFIGNYTEVLTTPRSSRQQQQHCETLSNYWRQWHQQSKTQEFRDNDNNIWKIRTRKENQQHPKRTREQEINDLYILKQQMDYQDCFLTHDIEFGIYRESNNNTSDNDEHNKTQDD